jgi:flagellar hook-associated protein 3 FlgL
MRVTASSFPNVLNYQLGQLATKQARLQVQAGTGQRFSAPSEDPRAMRKVLDLQSEIKSLIQYEKNIGALKDTLSASYSAATQVKKISDRANEITTRSDGLRTPEELNTYAIEVDQLIEGALQLANTRHQDGYLFGGTKNTQMPFTATRDADGRITGVTYNGSETVNEVEVAEGITVKVNIAGVNTSGTGDRALFGDSHSGVGADLFQHLIDLRDHLRSGDTDTIRTTDLDNLLRDEDNILFHYGNIGAVESRLDTASALANQRKGSLGGLVSNESDADLAQTLVALSEIQNAYTAALKTGGTILSQSLLDFLR